MTKDTQSAGLIGAFTTCIAMGLLVYMYAEAKTKKEMKTVTYEQERH
jgi:hypothetical protein